MIATPLSHAEAQSRLAAFTSNLRRHLDDEEYRAVQLSLVLRPDQGAVIPGGAGLRLAPLLAALCSALCGAVHMDLKGVDS
jgi:hypothetical protein